MLKTITLSAVLAAIVATTTSAAFAAPRYTPVVPPTGAEAWQDRGIADDNGLPYRR